MPRYDYKCKEHGYFEQFNKIADRTEGLCPICQSRSIQVILSAPRPMIEMMADAGLPGAFMTSGDRMEKRHQKAGQDHSASVSQARELAARDADWQRNAADFNRQMNKAGT